MFKKLFTTLVLITLIAFNVSAKIFEIPTDDIISRLILGANLEPSAIKTWDGGGATNNWTDAANWSGDTVPTASDVAIFDATSVKNATIDQSISVGGIEIRNGYTGVITQDADANLTVFGFASLSSSFILESGTFNQSGADITFSNHFYLRGGTFNAGGGTLTVNGLFDQTGGTFNGATGIFDFNGVNSGNFTITGGIFNAPSSDLFINQGFIKSGGTFNHNNGTVTFDGASNTINSNDPFFNLNIEKTTFIIGFSATVLGTLNLNSGTIEFNPIEASGAINISQNFGGGGAFLKIIEGAAARTVTFLGGTNLPHIDLDDPLVTIQTAGTGTLNWRSLFLRQGTVNQGNLPFNFDQVNTTYGINVSGGTFNASDQTININNSGLQVNGGAFNGSSGNIVIDNTDTNLSQVLLSGGTFTASSGTMFINGFYRHEGGGTFNHNNGTVIFDALAGQPSITSNDTFFNLTLDGTGYFIFGTVVVENNTLLNTGSFINLFGGDNGTINAKGNLTISSTFNGGTGAIKFSGAANQTYTNNGGQNPTGNWRLDKSGGTVTLASDLDIKNLDGGTQLFLTNGTITTGAFTLNAGLRPITHTNGFIRGKLRRDFDTANVQREFPIGSANAYSPVNAFIHSFSGANPGLTIEAVQGTHPSLPSTALGRYWNVTEHDNVNAGFVFAYRDPLDINGSEANYRVAKIDSAVTFLNEADAPIDRQQNFFMVGVSQDFASYTLGEFADPLQISPANATVNSGNQITFTANGGNPPYSFSILTNNSGGTINPSIGIYTAGATFGVTDTVRVTDANGGTADATVSVISPFLVVNTNDSGGGSLRQALQNANSTAGVQTVTFDIPGNAPHTIQILNPLTVTDGTNIDGSTQPGYTGSPVIEIDGGNVAPGADGIRLFGGGSTIKSLAINRVQASSNSGGAGIAEITGGNYTIQNCFIGTDTTGTVSLGNDKGISIGNSLIGGSRQNNEGNIISGNRIGIESGDGNTIQGNYIGTNPNGNNLGNGTGILIQGGVNNLVGDGADPNKSNTITFSNATDSASFAGDGIHILSFTGANGTSNRIVGNSIFQNVREGIDLSPDGITPNDPCDADTGANDLQNFPVITSADLASGGIQIQGTLNSKPSQTYTLDFYGNYDNDPSNTSEGEIYLGSASVTTGADCNSSFNAFLPVSQPNFDFITATATDSNGNTSEFSARSSLSQNIVLIVTNTNDSGSGSLRDAITLANSMPGTQTVRFNIAGNAPFTINVNSVFPIITDPIIIDGTTQPGFAGSPIVELRAAIGVPIGLRITSGNSTVKGLVINSFPFAAIMLQTGGNNTIQSNRIGTNIAGNTDLGNFSGIHISNGSSNNLIGGAGAGNLISGNLSGVEILPTSNGNNVRNNLIGINADGTAAVGNDRGIAVKSNNNTISENVISGNLTNGIVVGGSVLLGGSGTENNSISNNLIGLSPDGVNVIGNGHYGIFVLEAQTRGTRLVANRIKGNGFMGIKLSNTAIFSTFNVPLLNDPQDPDTGANNYQNYPVLTSVNLSNGVALASGTLNSTPSSNFRLEFFSSSSCDDSGNGEGEKFVGFTDVTTDAGGIAAFNSIPFPFNELGTNFITATATDADGNTSEFSRCQLAAPSVDIAGRITNTSGQPVSNILVRLTNPTVSPFSRFASTDSNGNYVFSNLAPADYTLTPSSNIFTFTPANRFYPNLTTSQINQNFTAAPRPSISGRARTNTFGATVAESKTNNILPPVPAGRFSLTGVNFRITGDGVDQTVTNDAFGNYRISGLSPGNYTVTPSRTNYVFTPPSATVNFDGDELVLDFVGESLGASTLAGRIIYHSFGDIEAMNADGSGVVSLESASSRTFFYSSPSFSGTGHQAVFLRHRSNTNSVSIVTVNADGSNDTAVLTHNIEDLESPVLSFDGSKIAFNDTQDRLFVMNADGSGLRQISGSCRDAGWSPDDQKLVCVNDSGVIIIDLVQNSETVLNNLSGEKFSPRFSPDGTRVAFIRRQAGNPATHSIVVKTLDPNPAQTIISGTANLFRTLAWSPDSARLLFIQQLTATSNRRLVTTQADGQVPIIINDNFLSDKVDWSRSNSIPTPASSTPTTIQSGAISLTFPATSGANAFTTITPIEPNSAGTVPNGFVFGNFAFEISTTTNFTPPVTICVNLNGNINNLFPPSSSPHLLHFENGVLVDVLNTYDPTTNTVCGQVNSFSPFVFAEPIDPNLSSITGIVVDSNGNPLSNIAMNLTGAENRMTKTDSDGIFRFVNLTNGANYNVQPYKVGYLFTEYNQDFVNVTGEQTTVFIGAAQNFQIGGRVTDGNGNGVSGVSVNLGGVASDETLTDANGNYVFMNLPADGFYTLTPSNGANSFSPATAMVSPLTSDLNGVDFQALAPTAANASISGKILTGSGVGIRNALVSLTKSNGETFSVYTGSFGNYRFENLPVGETYVLSVLSKRYIFANPTRLISLQDDLTDADFIAEER